MRGTGTREAGAQAEQLAGRMLEESGLRILARNFRCRLGEIDLVAQDGATYVFCEVRLRRSSGYGGSAESITHHKQRRIIAAARYFLSGRAEAACRFDVILFDELRLGAGRWIRDAFGE